MSAPTPPPGGQRWLALAGGAAFALATLGVIGLGSWRPALVLVIPVLLIALAFGLWRAARAPQRPSLRRLATLAGLGMLGALAAFALASGALWATVVGGGVVVAGVVIALGLALAASAFAGGDRARLRWLAVPALVIAVPAGVAATADLHHESADARPTAFAALPAGGYRISAGDLELDLRALPWRPGTRARLSVRADLGRALVLVPEGVCVTGRLRLGLGGVDLFGTGDGGPGFSVDLDRVPAPDAPALALDARVGLGAVQVLHEESEGGREGPGRGRDHRSPTAAEACPDPLAAS